MTKRIVVLVSGNGGNLQAILDAVDDGRLAVMTLKMCIHTCTTQAVAQAFSGFIITGHANQQGSRAERGDIQSHVGSTTGTILDLVDTHHRHRRLRRNPRGAAMPIAIEHHVAHHQDGGLIVTGHGQLHVNSGGLSLGGLVVYQAISKGAPSSSPMECKRA